MDVEKLDAELIRDEGIRLKVYKDSKGIMTIGVGHNLDRPISSAAAVQILSDDILAAVSDLDKFLPWWRDMNEVRQRVLVNMCFNMGVSRLLGFRNMLQALKVTGNWNQAAIEMRESRWYDDVGARADRLIKMMQTGEDL